VKDERRQELSIENSIDRLAAAIEKLASAVSKPEPTLHELDAATYAKAKEETRVEPRPATEQEIAAIDAADAAVAAKKPRGRPRKVAELTAGDKKAELVVEETGQVKIVDPTSAAAEAVAATGTASETSVKDPALTVKEQASASTVTVAAGSTESQISTPATVESNISKGDIVQILTGLQKKLEESATTIEEKRGAAQKCRDLINSVVGSESLKDAKPEHFGRIKSAVLKVLNNE
jgi:hypothetical protein